MFWERRIYADAAAATPLSRRSRREFMRLLAVYGNAGALHREAQEAKKELERARASIAQSIGAHPDEIVFTASGTEGNNLAIAGLLRPMLRASQKSLHAITIAIEHQSVLEPLRALKREGLEVTEVGVQKDGTVFPNAIVEALRPETVFVSVQLVNSEVGTIEPLREIEKGLRRAGRKIYFHTDASQAPLWVGINVDALGVDLMTLDGQKVLGPKGVGVLYIRRGTPVESILWGGKQEQGLRGGTENIPQAGAFAVALADAQKDVERRAKKVSRVRDYLWQEIKKVIPATILHGPGPQGDTLPGLSKVSPWKHRVANNLSVSVPGLDGEMAVIAMDALGVAVSTRSACNIGDEEPSHVIKALGVAKPLAKTTIRITLLPDISYRQARRIAAALKEAADRYRQRA
ncbi:MAG: cysteine desulfurase family protein [Patescibacteria group bacterium]